MDPDTINLRDFDQFEDVAEPLFFGQLLLKSLDEGGEDENWKFTGLASDEGQDEEGDTILRKSLDLSYAQQRGYVNWDHSRKPEDQLGYLTKVSLVGTAEKAALKKSMGVEISDNPTVYVEGELYKHMPRAGYVQKMLKSAPDPSKAPGLSLDGILARNSTTGEVVKAFVRGVAITPIPANPRTLCALRKSLLGYSRRESGLEASQLAKSATGGMTPDEAALWLLKSKPHWTYEFAVKLVNYTIQNKQGEVTK